MFACRICNNVEGNKSYVAREMQFGYRDEFDYIECARCGCLQIKDVPDDLSKYYPKDYYSFQPANSSITYTKKGIRGFKERFIRNQITKYYFNRKSVLGAWLEKKSCLSQDYPYWLKIQRLNLSVNLKSSILDVGCGSGQLLLELRAQGFRQLTGVDLFTEKDIIYDDHVRVYKRDLNSLNQQFDFIMLHHSFEHLREPLAILKKLYALLKPKRYLVLRIPVADSYAWRKYGVNWFALDAPRHLYLHTSKSMSILAAQTGFKVADIRYDSDGDTLKASEQYLRNIPIWDRRSAFVNPAQSIFSKGQLESFVALAADLNERGDADCAVFYLRKS